MTKKNRSADATLKLKANKVLKALNKMGCTEVTYTQVLEALARSEGARTLHVYEAPKPVEVEPKALSVVARRMAASLFFKDSGAWAGKEVDLMGQLEQLFLLEESRAVEAGWQELQKEGAVTAKAPYDMLRLQDWPAAFGSLVTELQTGLAKEAEVQGNGKDVLTLHAGLMQDWRVSEDSLDKAHPDAAPYAVTVGRNTVSHQFYLDVQRANKRLQDLDGTPQMSVFVEINQGVPCLHVTNEIYGDQMLSIFFTEGGLYLRPEDGDKLEFRNPPEALQTLHDKLYQGHRESGADRLIPESFLFLRNDA